MNSRSVFNYPGMIVFFPGVEFSLPVFDRSLLFGMGVIGLLPIIETLARNVGIVLHTFEAWLPIGAQFLLNYIKLTR